MTLVLLSDLHIKSGDTSNDILWLNHFCESTTDVFKDFSVYQLMDLDQESIENYLSRKGIGADTFFAECRRKDLTRIVANPFYLEHLVEHFGLSETLPIRKDLMASITEQCLKKDGEKFDYALEMSLEDKSHDLSVALVRMGYLLQLLRSTYCTEEQYQAMLPQSDRNILQYSSYTVKHPKGRMFSHNILQYC